MGDRNLELLEFQKIREILAGFTSFSASRQLALNLIPLSDEEEVRLRLKESAEARRLLSLSPDIHIGEVIDIREMVKMAALGKVLPPQSLLEIPKTLSADHRLKSHLMNLSHELPLLSGLANDIVALDQLAKDIDGCLSPTGELLDTASPKLASVRHRMREVRRALLTHLQAIITSPRGRKIGDVEKTYAITCEEYSEEVRGHTMFWNYLKEIELAGFIKVRPSGKGQVGNSQSISLPDIPAEVLRGKLEELLA